MFNAIKHKKIIRNISIRWEKTNHTFIYRYDLTPRKIVVHNYNPSTWEKSQYGYGKFKARQSYIVRLYLKDKTPPNKHPKQTNKKIKRGREEKDS